MSDGQHDVVVIGGGPGGLIAATYVARAGFKTLLIEAEPRLGGLCAPITDEEKFGGRHADTVFALDHDVLDELKLSRRGLRYAVRDLPLVGLRHQGRHLVLPRNGHAASTSIRRHSEPDATTYVRFQRALFGRARAGRLLWWDDAPDARVPRALQSLSFSNAAALLDSWFESDAIKATLAFDATADGVAIGEPPSALMLVWRAAQEASGLQGAVGVLRGGYPALIDALREAAETAGVEFRLDAPILRLVANDNAIARVVLRSGEEIATACVLSGVGKVRTLALLDPAALELGESFKGTGSEVSSARIRLILDRPPEFDARLVGASRFVVAERLDSHAMAHIASRLGKLPDEVVYEAVGVPIDDGFELSILVRPVPRSVEGGWANAATILAGKVIASLSAFDRATTDRIRHIHVRTPDDVEAIHGPVSPASVERLLSPSQMRFESGVDGLYFCGADVEPVSSISGRAARAAARAAIARLRADAKGEAE
jgi:phytoene dehydrogenase-like protein